MKEKIVGWFAYCWAAITGLVSSFYEQPLSDINRTALLVSMTAAIFTAGVNFWYRKRKFEAFLEKNSKED